MTEIAVLGAGGVGGLVAAALSRSGTEVTVVAREETASALSERGLRVSSAALGDFEAHPPAVAELTEPVPVLIVATKAIGLETALDRIRAVPGLVVPLLNGLDHLAVLRSRFGADRVGAAVIRVESDRPETGVILQTSPACRVDLAAGPPSSEAALRGLAAALEAAGIAVRTGDSEARVMWSKLARLCPLALTTSASERPLGFIRTDPRWRSALEGAVNETVRVANADGARLAAADTMAELETAHAELSSSMARDIAAGREPELDAIAGAVLRAGERHGVRCPTVQWMADRVANRAGVAWVV